MADSVARLGALGAALTILALPGAGSAQTAYQLNRANQALQICASPMGATIPECAQVRGMVGVPAAPAAGLLGGVAPAAGGGIAGGLLGAAAQAFTASRAPAAPAAPVGSQQYYVNSAQATYDAGARYQACVMRVGPTNQAGVQGCIAEMAAASGGAPAPAVPAYQAPAYAAAPAPRADPAAEYQACVMRVGATNSAGIQGCIAAMNAAAAGAPAPPASGAAMGAAASAFSALLGAR